MKLLGAVRELLIGDPLDYATDVGPVIDAEAKEGLEQHKERMRREARELLYGKRRGVYRILFEIRNNVVHVLRVRHSAQRPLGESEN